MSEFTCKNCKHFEAHAICQDSVEPYPDMPICAKFETQDGKRPRFCRLASSVDEMAELLVHKEVFTSKDELIMYYVDFEEGYFKTKEDAVAAAKKWLMEMEV